MEQTAAKMYIILFPVGQKFLSFLSWENAALFFLIHGVQQSVMYIKKSWVADCMLKSSLFRKVRQRLTRKERVGWLVKCAWNTLYSQLQVMALKRILTIKTYFNYLHQQHPSCQSRVRIELGFYEVLTIPGRTWPPHHARSVSPPGQWTPPWFPAKHITVWPQLWCN